MTQHAMECTSEKVIALGLLLVCRSELLQGGSLKLKLYLAVELNIVRGG